MGLKEYREKRRFQQTPEPPGGGARAGAEAGGPRRRFVVQEHDARSRHWDLRLEMEGVLCSWAVPKGPSLDPADKRLAVLVEDHPVEYGDFEGVIPPGNYGAGTVMVWDRGEYLCREGDPVAAFRTGKMTLECFGEKLRGEFHFVRTKRNGGRDWLLFKGRDRFAVTGYSPVGTRSVKSARPIEQIAADAGERWQPPVAPEASEAARPRRKSASARSAGRKRADADDDGGGDGADPFPEAFAPMLAQAASEPFDRPGWLFEVKWDGVRALAYVQRRGSVRRIALLSRTMRRLNAQFPEVVDALSRLDVRSAVLDGEIIAPDDAGRSSFARLQARLRTATAPDGAGRDPAVVYAVFDCLYLNGRDLRRAPLSARRRSLDALSMPPGLLRTDAVEERGAALFDAAKAHGLEGIVGKRAASPYRPGARSADWRKVKVRSTTEAVVGGFTRGTGQRTRTFGALVLGRPDPESGRLIPVGQVGGGFTDAGLRAIRRRLEPIVRRTSPFASPPRLLASATWVRPELVVEVSHGGWTPDGVLRFPVFVRTRDDMSPRDVRLPPAVAVPPAEEAHPPDPAGAAPGRRRGGVRRSGQVALSNLDKVFFPALGLTKGDVAGYYRRIAPQLLPHLRDRPLALRRFPDGLAGDDFFQKDVPDAPAYVRRVRLWSDQGRRDIDAVVGADDATLLWLVQLGCIEMHPWFSRTAPAAGPRGGRPATTFTGSAGALARSVLNYPDVVVFDIDPFIYPPGAGPERRRGELDPDYSRQGFEAAREAALWVADALDALGLRSFAKTSGKTGIHVFVPIERRYTYAQTHAFAKTLATWLVRRHPERLTTAWAVRDRVGKVFLDYNQNVRGKTIASVYSLRPVPEATVSVPVTWDEVRAGIDPMEWTIATVFDRLARVGDLWAGILAAAQRLEADGAPVPRRARR